MDWNQSYWPPRVYQRLASLLFSDDEDLPPSIGGRNENFRVSSRGYLFYTIGMCIYLIRDIFQP